MDGGLSVTLQWGDELIGLGQFSSLPAREFLGHCNYNPRVLNQSIYHLELLYIIHVQRSDSNKPSRGVHSSSFLFPLSSVFVQASHKRANMPHARQKSSLPRPAPTATAHVPLCTAHSIQHTVRPYSDSTCVPPTAAPAPHAPSESPSSVG